MTGEDSAAGLRICAVGASAGGLEAMLKLFGAARQGSGVAYVVAQHMGKNGHDALLARLLERASALPVRLACDGETLCADTVHVIPAGRDGRVEGGVLHVCEPAPGRRSMPSVDVLFASIAKAAGAHAIGVVLSGTGADGTAGCREIQRAGGLTLAQAPAEAAFDGMPLAAIEAGVADRVLEVEQIACQLSRVAQSPQPASQLGDSGRELPAESSPLQAVLPTLLAGIEAETGVDFSRYKEETLLRRLEKRIATLGSGSADDYLAFALRDTAELRAVQQAFLVSVSSFFRDRASFEALSRVLGALIDEKAPGEAIRVWVPGCASGEEAYSLAILLQELSSIHPIRITASDLNPEALARGEAGLFPASAFKEMPPAYRERYFVAEGDLFRIDTRIKDLVQFERGDVLSDAAPTECELVSCRNLMIYLKSALQDQLMQRFHHALRPRGLLFIGQAESLTLAANSLFVTVDAHHRLYRRRA